MCSPATCSTCGKVTWAGCGQHIDQVFANVPQDRRCPGHDSSTGSNASFINKLLSFR